MRVLFVVIALAMANPPSQEAIQTPQVKSEQQADGVAKSEQQPTQGPPSAAAPNQQNCCKVAEHREDEGTEFWPPFLGYRLKITDTLLALFTLGLVAVTGFLVRRTRQLWEATLEADKARAKDTEILQRARVAVLPRGIKPYTSKDGRLSCEVAFFNSGNLPADRLRWFLDRKFSTDPKDTNFPIKEIFHGSNVLPAKVEMRKGALGISGTEFDAFKEGGKGDDRWLYIWGEVRYRDGFNRNRFTRFCHRYNLLGESGWKIAQENGRYHEYGNHTDEDPPISASANMTLEPLMMQATATVGEADAPRA